MKYVNTTIGKMGFEEIESLENVSDDGTYMLSNGQLWSVEHVTPYGEEQLSQRYSDMLFFNGEDGRRYYALEITQMISNGKRVEETRKALSQKIRLYERRIYVLHRRLEQTKNNQFLCK